MSNLKIVANKMAAVEIKDLWHFEFETPKIYPIVNIGEKYILLNEEINRIYSSPLFELHEVNYLTPLSCNSIFYELPAGQHVEVYMTTTGISTVVHMNFNWKYHCTYIITDDEYIKVCKDGRVVKGTVLDVTDEFVKLQYNKENSGL